MRARPWQVTTLWVATAVAALCVPVAAVGAAVGADRAPGTTGAGSAGYPRAQSGQPIPLPPRETTVAASSGLSGVSCFSPTDCVVVGGGGTPSKPRGLAEQIVTGRKTTPVLVSQAGSSLDAVSCPESGLCLVAGTAQVEAKGASVDDGLIAVFSHGAFHDVSLYNAGTGKTLTFRGVACRTAESCYVVGFVFDNFDNVYEGAFTEVTLDPADSTFTASLGYIPRTADLAGITCSTRTRCYAVGAAPTRDDVYQAAAITIVNGIIDNPVATDLTAYGGDEAVACRSATVCTTVGQIETNESDFIFEAYIEPLGSEGGGTAHVLSSLEYLWGIATLDSHHQIAVGDEPGGIPITDLVTNGVASPHLDGVSANLMGISCPSTTYCMAVGAIGSPTSKGAIVRLSYENLPGAPGLALKAVAARSVELELTRPGNTGNAKLADYRLLVQACRAHHSGCVPASSRTLTLRAPGTVTVDSLKPGTRYRFQAFASNAVGVGPGSPGLEATTKAG